MPKELKDDNQASLRERAQALVKKEPEDLGKLTLEEVRALVQEFKVHQIELELQNEELRHTQKALEDARNRYYRLYHNAPCGYAILDFSGIIKQANATFSSMVKLEGAAIQGKAFADLLTPEDASIFRARFKALIKNPVGKSITVRFGTENHTLRHAQLEVASHQENHVPQSESYNELLITVSDITLQKQAEDALESALGESRFREREVSELLDGALTILEHEDFLTNAQKIFDACCKLTGASSGYVALLSPDGSENEVLFLEAGGLPCTVDPTLPMPVRGLREQAYKSKKAVYDNEFMDSQWADLMPAGHVALHNVLFAPLVVKGQSVGVIGLANKQGDFNDSDARITEGFSQLASIALQNSRNLDKRIAAENERKQVITDLQKALSEVRTLSGLLPICSHCKKIRDDKGYWKQIESYIRDHTGAEFSHSICQECAKKYYPDIDIYED